MLLSSQLIYYLESKLTNTSIFIIFNYDLYICIDIILQRDFEEQYRCLSAKNHTILVEVWKKQSQKANFYILIINLFILVNDMLNQTKQKKININSSTGNGSALLIFSIKDQTLSLELRETNQQAVYQIEISQGNHQSELTFTQYFQNMQQFISFLWQINEKYVSFSDSGLIEITILQQQFEIETLSLQLQKVTITDLMDKLSIFEREKIILLEQNKLVQEKYELELKNMKQELTSYKKIHNYTIQKLKSELERLTEIVHSKSNEQFVTYKKHHELTIFSKRIINPPSQDNEIRWAIIGRSPHKMNNPYFRIKINKLDWFAFGFCREGSIKQRNYSRFNACGDHGCFVMDNSGWVYASGSQHNYQRLGFVAKENQTLLIAYNCSSKILTFLNQTTWEKVQLIIEINTEDYAPCISCNKATDIEIVEISC